MSLNDLVPMDRYPCMGLSSPFYSIGSNYHKEPHEYDVVFDQAVEKGKRLDTQHAQRKNGCRLRASNLEGWLLELVRPLGTSPILGRVPVKIHALRSSTSCISLGPGLPDVARIEFVVHRYGDQRGVHYSCLVSSTLPYKLFAYKRVGTVPEGMLWSIDR